MGIVGEDVTVGRTREGGLRFFVLEKCLTLDKPGDAEGKERGRLKKNAWSDAGEQVLLTEFMDQKRQAREQGQGKKDHDSADGVDDVALLLFSRHGVAHSAHPEKHETKISEG